MNADEGRRGGGRRWISRERRPTQDAFRKCQGLKEGQRNGRLRSDSRFEHGFHSIGPSPARGGPKEPGAGRVGGDRLVVATVAIASAKAAPFTQNDWLPSSCEFVSAAGDRFGGRSCA